MKKITIILLIIFCVGCKNMFLNMTLKQVGAYDEKIILSKIITNNKEIVFMPMVHLSTKLFYEDVKNKIDSLKRAGQTH